MTDFERIIAAELRNIRAELNETKGQLVNLSQLILMDYDAEASPEEAAVLQLLCCDTQGNA